jgi:hypothetical protein
LAFLPVEEVDFSRDDLSEDGAPAVSIYRFAGKPFTSGVFPGFLTNKAENKDIVATGQN